MVMPPPVSLMAHPRGARRAAACSMQHKRPSRACQSPSECTVTLKSCTDYISEESLCTSLAIWRWIEATILQSARIVVHNSTLHALPAPGGFPLQREEKG